MILLYPDKSKVTGVAPQHDRNRNGVFVNCVLHQAVYFSSESVYTDSVIVHVHGGNIIHTPGNQR